MVKCGCFICPHDCSQHAASRVAPSIGAAGVIHPGNSAHTLIDEI